MKYRGPSRRCATFLLASAFLFPTVVLADQVIDLEWSDLLPKGQVPNPPLLRGMIEHDQGAMMSRQPESTGTRTDWNGQIVRLPGFIVPLDYDGAGVSAFLLVPYVGACIHVPPPPANQLVFVTTDRPYENAELFAPVNVTGMFGTSATSTQLANVAYALSADVIEPFEY